MGAFYEGAQLLFGAKRGTYAILPVSQKNLDKIPDKPDRRGILYIMIV
jgi:hypothetical protein